MFLRRNGLVGKSNYLIPSTLVVLGIAWGLYWMECQFGLKITSIPIRYMFLILGPTWVKKCEEFKVDVCYLDLFFLFASASCRH